MKLEVARTMFDGNVSPKIARLVSEVHQKKNALGAKGEQLTCQEISTAAEQILKVYNTENRGRQKPPPIYILALIFEKLTGDEYWNLNRFNRLRIISDLGDVAWRLTEPPNNMSVYLIGSLRRQAKEYSKLHGIQLLEAFEVALLKFQSLPHKNNGTDLGPKMTKALREALSLPSQDVEPPTPSESEPAEPPEPIEARKVKPVRLPRKITNEEETRRFTEFRTSYEELIKFALRDTPEEDLPTKEATARSEFRGTVQFLKELGRSSDVERETERRQYLRACEDLGVEVPKNGLCNLVQARRRYREQVRPLHPDHQGTDAERFQTLVESWAVLRKYHDRYERKEKINATVRSST